MQHRKKCLHDPPNILFIELMNAYETEIHELTLHQMASKLIIGELANNFQNKKVQK